ncbi:hypothetical protein V8C37DRAFT_365403 [Trichoderma ceciliae]
MSAPSYKFFPIEPIFNKLKADAISEILVSPIKKSVFPKVLPPGYLIERAISDANASEALHNFGMPTACQIYADAVLGSLQKPLEAYFLDQGSAIDVRYPRHQASTQLNQNNSFLLPQDQVHLILPLFSGTCTAVFERVDPLLLKLLQYAVDWKPNEALCLQGDIGFSIPGGNIRFILSEYPTSQNSSDTATI